MGGGVVVVVVVAVAAGWGNTCLVKNDGLLNC